MTNKELQEFNIGERVMHELWGVGTISLIHNDGIYTVKFDCDLVPTPRKVNRLRLERFSY